MIYELDPFEAHYDLAKFKSKRAALMAALLAAFTLSFTGPTRPAAAPAFRQCDYPPHTFVKARRRRLKGYERGKKSGR